MDEASGIQPTDPGPVGVPPRRRWPRAIALLLGVLVVLALVGVLGTRALYSRAFDSLVETTRSAEGAEIWRDFFVAQDCFIASVVEAADPDLAFDDALGLLDETDLLTQHVTRSLASFADVSILPIHSALGAARDSIAAHYQVWEDHLAGAASILGTLDPDPVQLAVVFQAWVDEVVTDTEAIETTFLASESAFQTAALDDPARQEIDTLFTPSEAECTRGAV